MTVNAAAAIPTRTPTRMADLRGLSDAARDDAAAPCAPTSRPAGEADTPPAPTLSALCALLHLASPQLPVGGFSYSQGLEAAIAHGLVTDEASARTWIAQVLELGFARCEGPLWLLQWQAWQAHDMRALRAWNTWFLASRDSSEARAETLQMGWSLQRLLLAVEWGGASFAPTRAALAALPDPEEGVAYPTAFACACAAIEAAPAHALAAYAFAWLENQVAAAIKAVPLGQVAGQRILLALHPLLDRAVAEAGARAAHSPPQLDTLAPQWSVLQARHETQYSRLFRS